ncbi:hypothetical protein ROHU_028354 [Labeo rohita]|uniref:Uncharacterized protein n=1 Tax=Labeo rohita TaxID=84645 RepID=A0A498M6W8_LABRO|nr:hypothetical protein ROHU_028354 [Labeo rohita]
MEVGIREGVCNNSPAESTSPENGWRWSVGPIPGRRRQTTRYLSRDTPRRVGGPPRWRGSLPARARVEPPRVQILVVVANIQTRALKAEVEKGSM